MPKTVDAKTTFDFNNPFESFFKKHLYTNWYKNFSTPSRIIYNAVLGLVAAVSLSVIANNATLQFGGRGVGAAELANLSEPMALLTITAITAAALLVVGIIAFLLYHTTGNGIAAKKNVQTLPFGPSPADVFPNP